MDRRRRISDERIREILQTTPYSESEGEEIGTSTDEEYIPLPSSSSGQEPSAEEECSGEDTSRPNESDLIPIRPPTVLRETNTRKRRKIDDLPRTGSFLSAKDGTKWEVISHKPENGRINKQNLMKDLAGPTSYAKRRITHSEVMSAFTLFIDQFMIDNIVECTQVEVRSKTGDGNWSTYPGQIYGLLAIMYARGILGKGQPVQYIWSKQWGPPIFQKIMSRNRYKELLEVTDYRITNLRYFPQFGIVL